MSERLTDEQLREWASTKSPVLHNCATELIALRARVAKLEGAARGARETLINLGFTEGNAVIFDLDNACATLQDSPQ